MSSTILYVPQLSDLLQILRSGNPFFTFRVSLSRLFARDVTIKPHRLMRHVDRHLIRLGCLLHVSSEDNAIAHKQFKAAYIYTNKCLDSL